MILVCLQFCWPGNQLFRQLDRELRFGYQVNGSLVLATTPDEVKILKELMGRGIKNGVENLRIIDTKEELFEMEPHLNPNCIAALYAPDAGNVIPYGKYDMYLCVSLLLCLIVP